MTKDKLKIEYTCCSKEALDIWDKKEIESIIQKLVPHNERVVFVSEGMNFAPTFRIIINNCNIDIVLDSFGDIERN